MKKYPERKTLKITIQELSVHDVIEFEELRQLEQKHINEFKKLTIQSIPYSCGCYYPCNCPRDRLAVVGHRLETDNEYQNRIAKEDLENKQRMSKQEENERKMLETLKKKY